MGIGERYRTLLDAKLGGQGRASEQGSDGSPRTGQIPLSLLVKPDQLPNSHPSVGAGAVVKSALVFA